jgi:hypothetical protein
VKILVSEPVELLAGVKPSTDDAGLILTGVHDQSAQPLSEDVVCPFVLFGQPYLLLPIELLLCKCYRVHRLLTPTDVHEARSHRPMPTEESGSCARGRRIDRASSVS